MRIEVSFPSIQIDSSLKARFAKVLAGFSADTGTEVHVDSIYLVVAGHDWKFETEEEFDQATRLPDAIDRMHIFFSSPRHLLSGRVFFSSGGGLGTWEGPEPLAVQLQAAVDKFVNQEYQRSLTVKTKQPPSTAAQTLDIPHCELDADGLRDLAKAILASEEGEAAQVQRLEFTVTAGTLTLEIPGLERVLDNPALPGPFDAFAVDGRGEGARVAVSFERRRASKAQVRGPLSWVRAKKARLEGFFLQHPNSDFLGRSRALTAAILLVFFVGTFSLVGLTLNRLVWHSDVVAVLFWTIFLGLLVGMYALSDLWEKRISRCWISPAPRQKSFFRSVGGVVAGPIVSELVYIVVGVAIGWLLAGP